MSTEMNGTGTRPVEHSMKFRVAMMTPEWAVALLKNNHPNNRKPKRHKIEQYKADMRGGLWKLTHQGIGIDTNGHLVDGQNRLIAVEESGCTVPMVIVNGVPPKSIVAADCMAARSVVDAARICGKPFEKSETAFGSIVRFMMQSMQKEKVRPTHQEIINYAQVHKEAILFALDQTNKNTRGIAHAPFRAVVARAWYRRNSRTRLKAFCHGVMTGLVDNPKTDEAAVRLRAWFVENTMSAGGSERKKIYAKTEHALVAFLAEEEYPRTAMVTVEHFPLPDESEE